VGRAGPEGDGELRAVVFARAGNRGELRLGTVCSDYLPPDALGEEAQARVGLYRAPEGPRRPAACR